MASILYDDLVDSNGGQRAAYTLNNPVAFSFPGESGVFVGNDSDVP